jgi:hypothetical protein
MGSDAEAQAAISGMNGQSMGGRSVVVNEARPMEARPPRSGGFGGNFNLPDPGGGGGRNPGMNDPMPFILANLWWLIPVLMLFGLGKVPAVLATVIYALPPLVRLTDLGIRQVDVEVVEASKSFGSTPWQLLKDVKLPLARPSIMAGLNQSVMMALAMVVIASMIGSRGLGEDVLSGINNMDMGRGLQGGFSIVILAVVIDRITQAYGKGRRERQALRNNKKGVPA